MAHSEPRVVHSLFKEYHSCARSFSLLSPLPALSLCRPARLKRLKTPLPLLRTLPPPLLPPLRTLPPTLLPPLRALLTLLPVPLRALPTLLPVLRPPLRAPLPMPLLLLRTLPRRCNLRRLAKESGREGKPSCPFSLPGADA
jgi:hypothetical protein